MNYENKYNAIAKYVKEGGIEVNGRKKLVEVLGDVGSVFDYRTNCFTSAGYANHISECKPAIETFGFSGKVGSSLAAIDKMVSAGGYIMQGHRLYFCYCILKMNSSSKHLYPVMVVCSSSCFSPLCLFFP